MTIIITTTIIILLLLTTAVVKIFENTHIRVSIITTLVLVASSFVYLTSYLYNNNSKLRTLQIETVAKASPVQIEFKWNRINLFASIEIYRRTDVSQDWGEPLVSLSGFSSGYTDTTIEKGILYEYKLVKKRPLYEGHTFVSAGIEYKAPEEEKTILLIIDTNYKTPLSAEINILKQDLTGEGWNVLCKFVNISKTDHIEIKEIIYNSLKDIPTQKSAILIGHVAVPYSGDFAFDRHRNHKGAWAADTYYGDLSGSWTDTIVNSQTAAFSENHNIPGDGKFDQSYIPGFLDIAIGRIDFSNLPVYSDLDEIELTRRYLIKNHAFRSGEINPRHKAVINDEFPSFKPIRARASNGWANFTALLGKENIETTPFAEVANDSSFLFCHLSGPSGTENIGDITNAKDFASTDYMTTFVLLFGSYFGDWDKKNNIMRTIIASEGNPLISMWAGHPPIFMHPMGMGKNMGECFTHSINQCEDYLTLYSSRGIHVGIMGDPTLRMYNVKPIETIDYSLVKDQIMINWSSSPDSVIGYNIYKSKNKHSGYKKVNTDIIKQNSFDDTLIDSTQYYMVRAIKLQLSVTGSFYNESTGKIITVSNE